MLRSDPKLLQKECKDFRMKYGAEQFDIVFAPAVVYSPELGAVTTPETVLGSSRPGTVEGSSSASEENTQPPDL